MAPFGGGTHRKGLKSHQREHTCVREWHTATESTRKHFQVLPTGLKSETRQGKGRTQTWEVGSTGVETKGDRTRRDSKTPGTMAVSGQGAGGGAGKGMSSSLCPLLGHVQSLFRGIGTTCARSKNVPS